MKGPNLAGLGLLSKKIGAHLVHKVLDFSEYMVDFNFGRFFRTFLYHYIYFYFGMLSTPLVLIFDTIGLARNMSFWFGTKAV